MPLTKKDKEDIAAMLDAQLRAFLTSPAFQPPTPQASATFGGNPLELLAIEALRRSEPSVKSGLQAFIDRPRQPTGLGDVAVTAVADTLLVPRKRKKAVSKFNRAVAAGMAAVKKSKFMGGAGKITNPRSAFKAVNRGASFAMRGKKGATQGVTGVISRAVRRIL